MAQIRISAATSPIMAAAEVIAAAVRAMASKFSTEIPAATRAYRAPVPNAAFVSAGAKGGRWGWTPIHAWMFDDAHNGTVPKHPLFGNRKRWYYQPYRPFLEEGAEAGADAAMKVYADMDIPQLLIRSGWK